MGTAVRRRGRSLSEQGLQRWAALAVTALCGPLACAVPCVDDGLLAMQHAAACGAASTSTDSTANGESTTTTTTTTTTITTGATTVASTEESATTESDSGSSGAPGLCGDGQVDPPEACDDGANGDPDDGCTDLCALPACGDGLVQGSLGEACDLGEINSDVGACTSACQDATCGDGLVWAGVEDCDLGVNNSDAGPCTSTCDAAICGDGLTEAGVEACDDGNAVEVDACNFACKGTPSAFVITDQGDTALHGGPGGSDFDDPCPADAIVVGFKGALDIPGRIGKLQGICGAPTITDDGVMFLIHSTPSVDLPQQGLNVLNPWVSQCSEGSAVVGLRGKESTWVDELIVRCAAITIVVSMEGDYSISLGPIVELATVGNNNGGSDFAAEDCPPGLVAGGQRGRAGDVIDSIGLGCASVALPP